MRLLINKYETGKTTVFAMLTIFFKLIMHLKGVVPRNAFEHNSLIYVFSASKIKTE